jgi:precorrin-6A/cobalt-precorrin-6A reductase
MILLLGGTSETAPLVEHLTAAGFRLLVSTATDIPLDVPLHPHVQKRTGPLDEDSLAMLIHEYGIRGIVDATHPYATGIRATARKVADRMNLPYLSFLRPTFVPADEKIAWAADHEEAAGLACSFGQPILLTIGSKNLAPYVGESRRTGISLVARVLPQRKSLEACHSAGIPEELIITGRGPFSVEENRTVIRRFHIGVLVTKDSGAPGGVPEKLEAARLEDCHVVVIRRPNQTFLGAFENFKDLLEAVQTRVPKIDGMESKSLKKAPTPEAPRT